MDVKYMRIAPALPTTISHLEHEIHDKRFRPTYPPTEFRAALMALPSRTLIGPLELLEIHIYKMHAQVMTPSVIP
jgi:hypothetical protein